MLEPVSISLHAGQWLASDADAYAVLVGPVREGAQTIVRLGEVEA